MPTPVPVPLAAVPLFDRLVDEHPAAHTEAVPLRALDRDGLLESLRREAQDLLGTRCPFAPEQMAGRPRTTVDYGVPDISPLHPAGAAARTEIAARMQAALAAFEPRLRGARVEVHPVPGRPRELLALIEGVLAAPGAPQPVGFAVMVGGGRP
ncbi:MAG TPA: type VI secretion system baseplate subunit TssE [Longimicrobium sp.]|jgi:type VI secretion system lysozyme-like protein|uniref:type VI secretion system baseplate subunit TssE n=1 Tax=Longimicrobium sp. TaxID=2029185 RepID=UPI002ED982EC